MLNLQGFVGATYPVRPYYLTRTHIYYAHALAHYGTPFAEETRQFLNWPGIVLHCPETMEDKFQKCKAGGQDMTDIYRDVLTRCVGHSGGGIVATEISSHVGLGVYEEIAIAILELGIPVWVLRGRVLYPVRGAAKVSENKRFHAKLILA